MERTELIDLCDRGVVAQSQWLDRDSAIAQLQLAKCRLLLLAGCDFVIADRPVSDERTIWVDITFRGFDFFEEGAPETDLFYVPTAKRLDEAAGGDWY